MAGSRGPSKEPEILRSLGPMKMESGNDADHVTTPDEFARLFADRVNRTIAALVAVNRPVPTMSPSEFLVVGFLGKGTFGSVFAAVRAGTSGTELYAIKAFSKRRILNSETAAVFEYRLRNVQTEIAFLSAMDWEFIVKLHYVSRNNAYVYLVLEFLPGGTLYGVLSRRRLSQNDVRFFAAQIVLALEYLHASRIVHRDLKPANLLIGADGYLKLADFGLAGIIGANDGLVGTYEYMAPEMFNDRPCQPTTDWWSLGIIVYELLIRHRPFYSSPLTQLQNSIVHSPLTFPETCNLTDTARDFIYNLLQKSPFDRLGFGYNGSMRVKTHPFFARIEWVKLYMKKYKPTIPPKITAMQPVDEDYELYPDSNLLPDL